MIFSMIPGVRRPQERDRQWFSEISEVQGRELEYKGHRQSLESGNCETEVGSPQLETGSEGNPIAQLYKFPKETLNL